MAIEYTCPEEKGYKCPVCGRPWFVASVKNLDEWEIVCECCGEIVLSSDDVERKNKNGE